MERVESLSKIIEKAYNKGGRDGVTILIVEGARIHLEDNSKSKFKEYIVQLRLTTDIFTQQHKYDIIEVVNTVCNKIEQGVPF